MTKLSIFEMFCVNCHHLLASLLSCQRRMLILRLTVGVCSTLTGNRMLIPYYKIAMEILLYFSSTMLMGKFCACECEQDYKGQGGEACRRSAGANSESQP